MNNNRQWPELWQDYCDTFPEMALSKLRPHCHPRCLVQSSRAERALVLIHGLTDSPAFLADLAHHFHRHLGYNVYLPLLQGHGLKEPMGMRRVRLEQWLENVRFAVASAAQNATSVALGGLSAGGALSIYLAASGEQPGVDLYLFSPALGLASGPGGIPGNWAEWLLERSWVAEVDRVLGWVRPLIGRHPYRYNRVPFVSAAQLVRLMRRIKCLLPGVSARFSGRIFAAWSECDRVVSVAKIGALARHFPSERFTSHVLPASAGVAHASLVLQESMFPVDGRRQPLEAANPHFPELLAAIDRFSGGTSC